MFIIAGWVAALYCILSALAFAGSNEQPPITRVVGTLLSFAIGTWIIKALSLVA